MHILLVFTIISATLWTPVLTFSIKNQSLIEDNGRIDELSDQSFRLRTNTITLSGFSSGGAMASQFQVAHSQLFSGLGIFAAVYYRCAGNTGNKTHCFLKEGNNVETSIADALNYESLNLTDPLANLQNQKVFLWIGTKDEKLPIIETRLHMVNFYQHFIHNPTNILTKIQAATHLLPTDQVNQTCAEVTQRPDKYLGNCNYSGTYEMFKFLVGDSVRIKRPSGNLQVERLQKFNQSSFFGDESTYTTGLDDIGLYYVPKNCLPGKQVICLLHIFLHGCKMTRSLEGTNFIEKSGFLEVAEENNIIIIFPQAFAAKDNPNLQGCWDTYGSLDKNYANKDGIQIKTMYSMLEAVLKNADSVSKTNVVIGNPLLVKSITFVIYVMNYYLV